MLKTLMITVAVSGLMVTSAMAQATNPPSTTPPMATPSTPAAKVTDAGKFISMQGADQWVFSKFKGTDVIGPDNAHVGDVNDLLFDKTGKVVGVIVGVGGFLGIGEKNVAIDLAAFQVAPPDSSAASRGDDPNNIKLKVSWTKDQLKQAPDFQYFKSPAAATTGQRDRLAPAPRGPMTPPTPGER